MLGWESQRNILILLILLKTRVKGIQMSLYQVYLNGKAAAKSGNSTCPYTSGEEAAAWWRGYDEVKFPSDPADLVPCKYG